MPCSAPPSRSTGATTRWPTSRPPRSTWASGAACRPGRGADRSRRRPGRPARRRPRTRSQRRRRPSGARRRLLAAEEMESWLARRGLSAGEWMRWVRMDVARRVTAVPAGDAAPAAGTLYTEALCSGALSRSARWLTELLVAPRPQAAPGRARARPGPAGAARDRSGPGARGAAGPARAAHRPAGTRRSRHRGPDAIASQLRATQAEWLTVDYRVLELDAEAPPARPFSAYVTTG